MKLFEDRTASIISPTNNQKRVLTKIKSAATPEVAATEISKGNHLVTARDMLIKLNMITVDDNKAEITSQGEQIMKNQNLVDDMGELTDEGQKYAYDDKKPAPAPTQEGLIRSMNQTSTVELEEEKSLGTLKLDFDSASDSDRAAEFLKGTKISQHGPVMTVDILRNSLKASTILSKLRQEKIRFKDVSK